jgi:tRNA-dihydrouridine synthase
LTTVYENTDNAYQSNPSVGCPSDRVQSGSFGACLMQTPEVVAQCVDAMRQASDNAYQSNPSSVLLRIYA